ncbi:MAG: hypothetical protein LBV69_10905, partial [Bacteroidales bacterium]|nr:hypothetical protein [Bacteroidales bacterium]
MFLINGTLLIAQNEQNISEINVDNITDEDDDYILPKNVYFIGINANFGVVEPSLNEDIKLRQNLGNNPNSVHISGIHFAFGANFEYRAFRRFGLLLGIQYYGMSLKVSDNNSDFFYLQYKQENNTVYYAKTKEIKELANFVGIPISIKYL